MFSRRCLNLQNFPEEMQLYLPSSKRCKNIFERSEFSIMKVECNYVFFLTKLYQLREYYTRRKYCLIFIFKKKEIVE